MASGYAVAVMGIDFTLRYFYKVLLDLLPICNQDQGNKIRWVASGLSPPPVPHPLIFPFFSFLWIKEEIKTKELKKERRGVKGTLSFLAELHVLDYPTKRQVLLKTHLISTLSFILLSHSFFSSSFLQPLTVSLCECPGAVLIRISAERE